MCYIYVRDVFVVHFLRMGLGLQLRGLIGIHREGRLVLAALEGELLSNLASYDRVAGAVSVGGLWSRMRARA